MDPASIAALVQAGGGIIQSIFGGGRARRAERQLEKMVNSYQPNRSILDYYNKALERYSVNPYQSNMYNMQQRNIQRGTATGISALQDRRSAIGGVASIVQAQNDASLKAAAQAEQQGAQALGQLGQATQMKAQEDFKPFELKYNLQAMKAGGGNQIMNAGLSNIFGGIQNYGNYQTVKKMYG